MAARSAARWRAAFAREGAGSSSPGAPQAKLEAVADDIRAEGGTADTARSTRSTARRSTPTPTTRRRGIDISFNAISHNDVQGTPMAEMDVEDYLAPIVTGVRTNFLTWKAAAATHGAQRDPGLRRLRRPAARTTASAACRPRLEALESMRRQFSTENGKRGIRVVTLRTGGIARRRSRRTSRAATRS